MILSKLGMALIASISWAVSASIEQKTVLSKFSPYQIISYRSIVIGLLSLLFLTKESTIDHIKSISKQDWIYFFVSHAAGLLGLFSFFKLIGSHKKSTSISMVQPLVIVFVTLISYIFFGERLKTTEIAGIFAVVIGIILMNWDKIPQLI